MDNEDAFFVFITEVNYT